MSMVVRFSLSSERAVIFHKCRVLIAYSYSLIFDDGVEGRGNFFFEKNHIVNRCIVFQGFKQNRRLLHYFIERDKDYQTT